jgi:hypothetical protein
MSISIQIKTILFSFVFGFIFSVFLRLNYKFLMGSKRLLSFIFTFLFVLVFTFLFFIFLNLFNCGIFHIYEIILIIFGFFVENFFFSFVEKLLKK